ncbi:MAG: T9SS type A sorting domain-containing protein, partial [Flavobacteriales bacterium]|nr:T9SS type A sorting domain-containing protein [Flavobacteriales bacterium]
NALSAGTHCTTITDGNGCVASSCGTITDPTCAITLADSSTDEICVGSNGTATTSPSGGSTPYVYNWSASTGFQSTSSGTATALAAASYDVTVTGAALCTQTTTIVVSNNPGAFTTSNVCNGTSSAGASDGSSTTTPSGGTTPYTYAWSPAPATGQNTATATGLPANSYTVTVTDSNGCVASDNCVVNDPGCATTITPSSTPETCTASDGTATATPTGGTTPYSYNWAASAGAQSISSPTATGLAAGSYAVTVTDAAACPQTDLIVVSNNPGSFTTSNTCSNPTTVGGNDGSSTTTPSGGVTPYNYAWSPAPATGQNTGTATGLSAGSYTVTVTDGNGCIASDICAVNDPGCATTMTSSSTAETCTASDGTATATSTGGTTPYSYNWAASAGAQSTSSPTATGLAAGSYSVTVTDAAACTQTDVIVIGNNPGSFTVSNSCSNAITVGGSDGSSTTTPSGGVTPYSYSWSPAPAMGQNTGTATGLSAGTYSVTVTDGSGCIASDNCSISDPVCAITLTNSSTDEICTGSNGVATTVPAGGSIPYVYNWSASAGTQSTSSGTATALASASYSVTVTDAALCSQVASITVSNNSGALVANVSCTGTSSVGGNDGTAIATSTGGFSSYSYMWNNGQITQNATGLSAGNHCVTITDANGCMSSSCCSITDPSCSLSITSNSTDVLCNSDCNGTGIATPTGGVTPYAYTWSVLAGAQSTSLGIATALCPDTYGVTATDNVGCAISSSIAIGEPSILLVSYIKTDESCGSADGTATLNVSGGTSPYSYSWPSGNTANPETSLSIGSYTATATDNNGCSEMVSVVIDDISTLTASISPDKTICQGQSTSVTASGGTSYLWSTGETTPSINVTVSGSYICTVSAGGPCVDIVSSSVTVNPVPNPTISASADSICPGEAVTLTASGAQNYTWQPTLQTGSPAVVYPMPGSATYSVIGESDGCSGTSTDVEIFFYSPLPVAVAGANVTNIPVGGTVTFDGSGSVGDLFSWDFNGNGSTNTTTLTGGAFTYNTMGIYSAVLKAEIKGALCSVTDTIKIYVGDVAITEIGLGNSLTLYPNPTSGKLTIEFNLLKSDNVVIDVYNSIGELILSRQLSNVIKENYEIDLNNNARGVYLVSVRTSDDIVIRKVTLVK